MDRQSKGPLPEQSWTQQLLRKDGRGGEPKRRSWWPSSRKEAPAPSTAKKEPPSQDDDLPIRLDPTDSQHVSDRDVVPTQELVHTSIDSIRLNEHIATAPPASKRTAKSDGGSVGSNLKKLSIDDRKGSQQLNSPPTPARTKRAAEPSGQIPEGETRPSKRAPPQTALAENIQRKMSTDVTAHDTTNVGVNSLPGVVQLHQSHPSLALKRTSSDVALYNANDDCLDLTGKMLLQPETRPITQDQLVNEVKGIYAGLVMVEKKCVEIDQQQSKTTNKLSDEQWQALIALHRTLLYEHHDFFLASQHPSSSAALRRLATKYAMPARMWRHGIHSFLELLRHRLPDSLDHMLAFVYLAYSMMALLMESVPSFVETWIECLGDLARYRMAIEEVDLRDREIWSGCAKMWYEKAADKSPNVGRIQHHLAVLARPNIVQQLFYYSKALVSVTPFQNARESIMLLFNPFLQEGETISQKYIAVEAAFVTFNAVLFTHGLWKLYSSNVDIFLSGLDAHIARTGSKFRTQGPEIISALCAATFDFGSSEAFLIKAFQLDTERRAALKATTEENEPQDPLANEFQARLEDVRRRWESSEAEPGPHVDGKAYTPHDLVADSKITSTEEAAAQAVKTLGETTRIVTQRIGDKNIVPCMHVQLAFLWSLAHVPGALQYIQEQVPFEGLVSFLNTLGRSGVDESRVVGDEFPQHLSGTGRQLPEDFSMRGAVWAQHYYPTTFFQGPVVDEDERTLDLPSHAAPRAERCLWLGYQLARLHPWLSYDKESKKFSVTDYAGSLSLRAIGQTSESRSHTLSVDSDSDTRMLET